MQNTTFPRLIELISNLMHKGLPANRKQAREHTYQFNTTLAIKNLNMKVFLTWNYKHAYNNSI